MKKFKQFFFEKIDPYTISRWWHGYCYYDACRNLIFTCIFPFNFIAAILRSFYFMIKSAGYGADEFYRKQDQLRKLKSQKTEFNQQFYNNKN